MNEIDDETRIANEILHIFFNQLDIENREHSIVLVNIVLRIVIFQFFEDFEFNQHERDSFLKLLNEPIGESA